MNFKERVEWIETMKTEANTLYKENKYYEASEKYLEALCGFSFENQSKEDILEVNH